MHFKVTKNDIREDNPEIDVIREFQTLSDRQLKLIFLVYDYESPYRGISMELRKTAVAKDVGYTFKEDGTPNRHTAADMKCSTPKMMMALERFKRLQFNLEKESIATLQLLLRDIIFEINNPKTDIEKRAKLSKELPEVNSRLRDLRMAVGQIDEEDVEDDNGVLSTLDEFHDAEEEAGVATFKMK